MGTSNRPDDVQEGYDASDPLAVAGREVVARLARREQSKDLAAVVATPAGRRVLRRLMDRAGIHASTFDGDPCRSAFNEGRRSLGIELLVQVEDLGMETLIQVLRSTEPKKDDG